MKRFFTLFFSALPLLGITAQEIEITPSQAKALYKNTSHRRVSVHDPSIVYDSIKTNRYYIFGSHRGVAYSTDGMVNWTAVNKGNEVNGEGVASVIGVPWKVGNDNNVISSEAFKTPKLTKTTKGGQEVDLPNFDAQDWAACTDSKYHISGNLWAPDVIWNPVMKKWCMYLSVNGDKWHSSILLLTADEIEGPYEYQAPIVISGFDSKEHSYKKTDLELVLGQLSSLPSRYNSWATKSAYGYPNNIDPCVFYDEEGKLWMAYGSWSGGVFMIELDEETGLRDYNVSYSTLSGRSGDPYFGKRIAGGYYVSGEAPYIEHIGNYYYLFMTYGGLAARGGYVMRVFRSENPDGPYKDASGKSAIFDSYIMNYGSGKTDTRGVRILGAYDKWGFQSDGKDKEGELAQGHNSIIAAPDGRTYLVYHTRFNVGAMSNGEDFEGHSVRVHQVFQTQNGWIVASPFEYNGETLTDEDIKSRQIVADVDIPGDYEFLLHKYSIDHTKLEVVEPVKVRLNEDGSITGSYNGSWTLEEGTGYIQVKLGSTTYNGVLFEQQMDKKSIKTVAFSALADSGVNIWGYKMRGDYAIAWQYNNQTNPVTAAVKQNIDLYKMALGDENVTMLWTTSNPAAISQYGRYYPLGIEEDTKVDLTYRLSSGNYFLEESKTVTAYAEANSYPYNTTWQNGMVAQYKFADNLLTNSLDATQSAELKRNSTTALPTLENADVLRNDNFIHTAFGANGKESYVQIPNPLKGKDLTNGATISFFVKMNKLNRWDAIFGLMNGTARFYVTGNLYAGFNDGVAADESNSVYNNWIDINHPNMVEVDAVEDLRWHMLTIAVSPTATATTGGVTFYVDGVAHTADKYNAKLNGKEISTRNAFDYKLIIDLFKNADYLWLGNGSFWGSADAMFDDFIVYDRGNLSALEVKSLLQMINRADVKPDPSGINDMAADTELYEKMADNATFDLSGRRVQPLKPGLYIRNGRKFLVK